MKETKEKTEVQIEQYDALRYVWHMAKQFNTADEVREAVRSLMNELAKAPIDFDELKEKLPEIPFEIASDDPFEIIYVPLAEDLL